MKAQDTIDVIAAGLGLGIKAYESARRIEAAGYTVPNLQEFETRIIELHRLPRTVSQPSGCGGSPASKSVVYVGHA
ncbi:hypothetical protein [Halodesulfovibrio marinisediminis]|uniref:Uncharacterized protein n=1 Tax=Halodesulfovibrio marinisediminis DSM 17456 TaxID=1121457 RepID=A0A1N6I2D0_9BACT|nr:hypothetical protein [Halodesulfovibrio marinisediminis]SIO26163.1 hypothetical protein SAMN02745161_2359 [Halodesulfovibrio marinisediminis DSM 17456]